MKKINCHYCGAEIEVKTLKTRYCNYRCKNQAHRKGLSRKRDMSYHNEPTGTCAYCKQNVFSEKTKYCSKACRDKGYNDSRRKTKRIKYIPPTEATPEINERFNTFFSNIARKK